MWGSLFEDEEQRHARGLGDFHLRSALTTLDITELKEGVGRGREISSYKKIERHFKDISAGEAGWLVAKVCLDSNYSNPSSVPHLEAVKHLLEVEFRGLGPLICKGDPFHQLLTLLGNTSDIKSKTYHTKIKLQRALMVSNAMTSGRSYSEFGLENDHITGMPMQVIGGLQFLLFGELFVARTNSRKNAYRIDVLRMITDKITERDNVVLASFFGSQIFPEVYPEPDYLISIFSVFDRWLLERGNSGYILLKSFEAFITGLIIGKENSHYYNSQKFLSDTIKGHTKEERIVANQMIDLIKSHNPTLHHLTQIMGLFRLWGHPEVDTRKGVEKVRKIGTATKFISTHTSLSAGWKFKEIWYTQYYSKNRRYPNCKIINQENWISQLVLDQLPINLRDPRYHPSDWDSVLTMETFVVPKTFNLSMIVSDTAISPTREELYKSCQEGNPPLDPSVRRGVLKWMKDGLIDCKELLTGVCKHPHGLPKSHRVIGLYPKEREMNPTARMFALMSLMMRSYVVITENMLSENVVDLVPGITMTYSLLDLAKEMIRMTTSQRKQGNSSRTFCINMDFEKWNLNMRKESTLKVFEELGRMFGMPELYNRTYDIFKRSMIYLADGSYIPKINEEWDFISENQNEAYEGHIGGFEGLRQKGWTIFTVVLIAMVCDQMGIQYKLMGQGDNQVLMVTIHSRQARIYGIESDASKNEIITKLDSLIYNLRSKFDEVGLPLKPLETWVSDSFFSYGKMPIYSGLPLCSSLKRISRVFFFSNEDLMTTDNALGAITANAQSAAMVDIHPIISYFIAKWQHIQCLSIFSRYHPLVGGPPHNFDSETLWFNLTLKNKKKFMSTEARRISRKTIIMGLASIPKTLGGLNIVCYFDMILRGFSDPVCKDYQFLSLMADNSRGPLAFLLNNWSSVYLSPETDYLHLLQDPTSLNLLCPPTASTVIKRMIHKTIDGLESTSEFSRWFKELMSISAEKKVEPLVEKLTATEEVNVRLCHDILGATLYGYADSISSKIDKTVTLSRITLGQQDVVGSLINGERKIWDYLVWRCHVKGQSKRDQCPSEYIRVMRNKGWKKQVIGVSTPYPFHYLERDEIKTNRPDSYIEVVIGDDAVGDRSKMLMTSGSSLPYLGSVTREKLHSTASKAAYGTEPLITRPIKLLRAIGWFIDEESNWAKSLSELLRAVTDLDPLDVISVPDHVKGSMMHRYVDMALKHGSLWMSSFGPPSHMSISTNSLTEYAKGSKNVTVHFQALLGLVQFCALNQNLSDSPRKLLRYYRGCQHCITPVEDPTVDLPLPLTTNDIPSRPENPYLYVKKDDISLLHKQELENYTSVSQIHSPWLAERPELARRFLTEVLAVRSASSILSSSDRGDIVFDISGISRTTFLKVDIYDLFMTTAKMIWIGASTGKRIIDERIYPSWTYMKTSLIRRVWDCPISAFSILSGIYLWEDNLDYLMRVPWAVMPDTYPVTPTSIGLAAKNTLIKIIKQTKSITLPSSMLVSPLIRVDPGMILKSHLMFIKGKLRSKCSNCVVAGMSAFFKADYTWGDLTKIRCSEHHMVFSQKGWRLLMKINLDIESLADLVPTAPRIIEIFDMNKNELILDNCPDHGSTIFHSGQIRGYSLTRTLIPGEEFYERLTDTLDLKMQFALPTKSLYRIYDILGNVGVIKEMGTILVMGDGYGYSSMMVKAIAVNSKVLSWTLIDIPSSVQHCLRISKPPTHYALEMNIDNHLTLDEVADINNPMFPGTFGRVISENKVDAIISEIEYKYSDSQDRSSSLIHMSWQMRIKLVLIKYEIKSFHQIKQIIEEIWKYYRVWRIVETHSSGLHTGEVWLIMTDPRTERGSWKYLTIDSTEELYRCLRFSHESMMGWRVLPDSGLNSLLEKTRLVDYMMRLLDNWFQEANILGWDSLDMTQVFYGIKTGRRPEKVMGMHGNQIYYMHFGMENAMFVRLMVLAFSLLDDPGCIEVELSDDNQWDITWEKEGIYGGPRGVYQWAPALYKKDRESLLWSKQNRDLIKRYLPVVRARFDRMKIERQDKNEKRSIMDRVGKFIRFGYARGSGQSLHFPVTKIASYLVPSS